MSLLPVGFGASGDDYEITDSLRLRSSASAYLSRTFASAGNRRTWTWSGWVKRGLLGTDQLIFGSSPSGASGPSNYFFIPLMSNTIVYRNDKRILHFVTNNNTYFFFYGHKFGI